MDTTKSAKFQSLNGRLSGALKQQPNNEQENCKSMVPSTGGSDEASIRSN